MEFGRRMAVERDLEKTSQLALSNVLFDDSGFIVLYATMLGVKFVNVVTNQCVRFIGKPENVRLLHLSLFQGKVLFICLPLFYSDVIQLCNKKKAEKFLFFGYFGEFKKISVNFQTSMKIFMYKIKTESTSIPWILLDTAEFTTVNMPVWRGLNPTVKSIQKPNYFHIHTYIHTYYTEFAFSFSSQKLFCHAIFHLPITQVKTRKAATTLEMEAAKNPTLEAVQPDPTLFCTGFNKNRFYLFSR